MFCELTSGFGSIYLRNPTVEFTTHVLRNKKKRLCEKFAESAHAIFEPALT